MKLVDKAIDYVANRVLDRAEERRPVQRINVQNVHSIRNSESAGPLKSEKGAS